MEHKDNATLRKILVVEDDEDIRRIIEFSLEYASDFDTKLCSSGKEALAEINGFRPDLIILDAMMPEMDGISTLKALKNQDSTCNIPVVFMTARVHTNEIEEYKKAGAWGVIPKPFDPIKLADTIKKIWERSRE